MGSSYIDPQVIIPIQNNQTIKQSRAHQARLVGSWLFRHLEMDNLHHHADVCFLLVFGIAAQWTLEAVVSLGLVWGFETAVDSGTFEDVY